MKLSMKIRAHEAELLVVGTEEEQTAEITWIMLQGCTAEVPSRLPAEVPRRLVSRDSDPDCHHDTPQVSVVPAVVSSASRTKLCGRTTPAPLNDQVAVNLIAPHSRRRNHVVSCELYTERGSVPRRTGTVQARLHQPSRG